MVQIVTSKIFAKFPHIKHGYFTRKGGVSDGNYTSLNFGYNSGDLKENIEKNYQIAAKHLNIPVANIITLIQTHSDIIHEYKQNNIIKANAVAGDAVFTLEKNIAMSVLTADCLPILIYASDLDVISAIHAGWRGAFSGIINKFIEQILQQGAKAKNIYIALMPSICQASYEVDINFYNNFMWQNPKNIDCFKKTTNHKFLFNLRLYAKNILQSYKITNIDDINLDTYSNNNKCFSHRKFTHGNQLSTGRNLSFIIKTN